MLRSFLCFLLLHITVNCSSQDYQSEVARAGNAYDRKQFDSCAFYFSRAFEINKTNGSDLYNAAVCNALNGNRKKAFDLLSQAVVNGANISKLKIDPDFEDLRKYHKWKRLLKKANRIQLDSFNKYEYPAIALRLSALWEKDQYYRFRLAKAYDSKDTARANQLWTLMRKSDSVTLVEFQSIMDTIGWPTVSKVGRLGASTAFLIIDHSPREVMEKYFPFLETAAKKGEASMSSYATMKDRILVNRGKKQIYGTQKYWDQLQNKFVFFPIEDEKNVNSLRKEVGLPPLREFEKL